MKKTLICAAMVCTMFFAGRGLQAADSAQDMPSIIRVCRAEARPGNQSAYSGRAGASMPFDYLALAPLSGPPEVWYVEFHSNYASIEPTALQASASRPAAQKGFFASEQFCPRGVKWIASYHKDLSYGGERLAR